MRKEEMRKLDAKKNFKKTGGSLVYFKDILYLCSRNLSSP
jgi:hypothetical protein